MFNIFRFISNSGSLYYVIAFYLLVSVFFSICYFTFIPFLDGTPSLVHNMRSGQGKVAADFFECFYFSITSQTTVGYGDIVPATTTARGVIIVQVIFGYFYLAFTIAFFTARAILKSEKFEAIIRRMTDEKFMH